MGDVAECLLCELTKIGGLAVARVTRSDGILRPFYWDKLAALGAIEEALAAARRAGAEEMRERAAAVIGGRPTESSATGHHYRSWPEWGSGNQGSDDEITKFADAMSDAIRALPLEG